MRSALPTALCVLPALPAFLAACGGPCPDVARIDATAGEPSLVEVLFSVRCHGEPVTTITAADVALTEEGAEVSASEAEWRLDPQEAVLETYTLLMIDVSDSIIESGTLPVAQEVARDFVDTLLARNQSVSVAIFDGATDIRTVVGFTRDAEALATGIDGIGPGSQIDGSTNLNGAVLQGLDVLDLRVQPDVEAELLSIGNLVIFTDGSDRAGRETDSAARTAARGSDHAVFVVGLVGEDAAADLEALGDDGFFQAEEPSDLYATFEDLADRLVAEVNQYYLLSYCSPLRSPRTTLRIEVSYEDRSDAITFSYPTGDFGAGCDLQ